MSEELSLLSGFDTVAIHTAPRTNLLPAQSGAPLSHRPIVEALNGYGKNKPAHAPRAPSEVLRGSLTSE